MALEEEQIVDELATGAIELNVSALPDEKLRWRVSIGSHPSSTSN